MSENNREIAVPTYEQVKEAGGEEAFIVSELRKRGLLDEGVDVASLSEKEKKQYKVRREEERRVRKLLQKATWAAYRKAHLVHVGAGIFHHDTADIDKFDIADLEGRRKANEVPELSDVTALAKALELPIPRLRWLVYHRDVDTGSHYHFWTVPKRSGGFRLISAPKPDLKKAQSWVARHITERLPVHGAAHGFVPGRSTLTHARAHAGADIIVKFDLKDFYPTINWKRVKGLFRKTGYGEQVATVMALLCTEPPREKVEVRGKTHFVALGPRALPQGAPTSPSITNALCLRLDCRLTGLAHKLGLRYTRYADDLTFSWRSRTGGGAGSSQEPGARGSGDQEPLPPGAPLGILMKAVAQITTSEGFQLHPGKTRVMRRGGCQRITGLVVNEVASGRPVARVPRATRRLLRAALHNRERGRAHADESLEHLQGLAAYVTMTDRKLGRRLLARFKALRQASEGQDKEGASDE